jgi:DNA-directed RNA polymerase I and III subunit RPAC2
MKDPSVELCGYTLPHPMEDLIKIRVQAARDSEFTSSECLRKGLQRMMRGTDTWVDKFNLALERVPLEVEPKLDLDALLQAKEQREDL